MVWHTSVCIFTTILSFLQDQATRRLAAVYRSALRLLQKYQGPGHTSQPLPPELSLLLQQLSLLSQHFGVGGANSELDTTVKVLQVSMQCEVLWGNIIEWLSVCIGVGQGERECVGIKAECECEGGQNAPEADHTKDREES